MKTLLAYITQTENAESFIDYSAKLSKDLNYNLHFLYVQPNDAHVYSKSLTARPTIELDPFYKKEKERVEKYFQTIQDKMSKEQGIDFSFEIGTDILVLEEYISKNKVHIIAFEGNNQNNIFSLELSSIDLISKVNCPVIIVPENTEYKKYEKVLYATNYNEEDIKTLKNLISLTKNFSPEITALHVTESSDFEKKTLEVGFNELVQREAKYDKILIQSLVNHDSSIAEAINDFASIDNSDLIVLLKENTGFLESIFKSSTTEKLLKKSQTPVLVYQEK